MIGKIFGALVSLAFVFGSLTVNIEAVGKAADAAVCLIEKGVQEAQNKFN